MAHRTSQQVIDDLISEHPNAGKDSPEDEFLTLLGFTDPEVRLRMKLESAKDAADRGATHEADADPSRRSDHDTHSRSSSSTSGYEAAASIARTTIQTVTYSSMM